MWFLAHIWALPLCFFVSKLESVLKWSSLLFLHIFYLLLMKYFALICYYNGLFLVTPFPFPSSKFITFWLFCRYFQEVIDLDLICTWILVIILNLWQENILVLQALGWMVLKCLYVGLQLTLSPQRYIVFHSSLIIWF